MVVVSHAREFLNAVCTDIVHLQSRKLAVYRGDYTNFEATRAELQRTLCRQAEAASVRKAQMQAFIDKFRFSASRAALVQSRIKAMERMADVVLLEDDPESVFRFPEPAEATGALISFDDVSFSYAPGESRDIFKRVSFGLDAGSRLAIVGPNGIGKSTLLGLISGSLAATGGHITRSNKCRIAIFAQHHGAPALAPRPFVHSLTPVFHSGRTGHEHQSAGRDGAGLSGRGRAGAARPPGRLRRDGRARAAAHVHSQRGAEEPRRLRQDDVVKTQPAAAGRAHKPCVAAALVSPGQRRSLPPPPDLDMASIDALAEALSTWGGGVLLVSHDQHFIQSVANQLWAVTDGVVTPYEGTFEEYKNSLLKKH